MDGRFLVFVRSLSQATFPLDVFKTRMQTMPWDDRDGPRSLSLRHVALQAVRQEGWRVMFAGLGPTLIR